MICCGSTVLHDLIFVLDANLMTSLDQLNSIKQFMVQFVTTIQPSVGPGSSRVALCIYRSSARVVFGLDTYSSANGITSAIHRLSFTQVSTTNLTAGLSWANQLVAATKTHFINRQTTVVIMSGYVSMLSKIDVALAGSVREVAEVYGITPDSGQSQYWQRICSRPTTDYSFQTLSVDEMQAIVGVVRRRMESGKSESSCCSAIFLFLFYFVFL